LIGITTDIAMMYRMINVKPKYQSLQRILWRKLGEPDLKCFQLSTVTCTASASYQATRTLMQLVTDEGEQFPLASEALELNSYLDDIITGANDLNSAVQVQDELISLLGKGGFTLHKWHSNDQEVLSRIPDEKRESCSFQFPDGSFTLKTLGLFWNPTSDVFQVTVPNEIMNIMKRNILSVISKIYDPLGLVSVVVIKAKIIMQSLWKEELDWDSPVPDHITIAWNSFVETITLLREIKVPRVIFHQDYDDFQCHGFADSLTKAYGCAIYLRATNKSNKRSMVRLICSKSRVAPLKPTSLPRLELCASLLLARLMQTVLRELHMNVTSYNCWTDSTIALSWIQSHPARWNVFVANRVVEIQDLTDKRSWRHVLSTDNPADLVSRGLTSKSLDRCSLWWEAPAWLSKPEELWQTTQMSTKVIDLPEKKVVSHSTIVKSTNKSYLLEKLHSFSK
jgi:hypothetical protein